ncbi:MAG: GNAT family N-acetyltransferase, partial [Candidatus Ornithomonoglobus sp.]
FSFGFTGSDAQLDKFLRHLRYFSYHVNIGDVRSLIVNSPKTTHAELDSEHLKRAGIDVNTVRISAGLESADDLIRDLDEAFDFVFGNNETEITSAGIEDLEEIAALEKLCFPPGKAASEEAFLYRLKSYPEWFLTARINGTIVGLINGAPSDRQFITDDVYKPGGAYNKSGESLLIYGLIVHPDYRRRGIASRLIKTMLEKAAHHNKKHIALTAREALIPYYEGFGFRNHGISESVTGGVAGYDLALDIK